MYSLYCAVLKYYTAQFSLVFIWLSQFVLFVLLYSTNVHRWTNKPDCTTAAFTWPVVKITKPLPHLIQLRWQRKMKILKNNMSDLSFLLKLGQRPSFTETEINNPLAFVISLDLLWRRPLLKNKLQTKNQRPTFVNSDFLWRRPLIYTLEDNLRIL